jgi:hypothetical protein
VVAVVVVVVVGCASRVEQETTRKEVMKNLAMMQGLMMKTVTYMPCLALPCLALPCLALPCLALPCLAVACVCWCLEYNCTSSAQLTPGLSWLVSVQVLEEIRIGDGATSPTASEASAKSKRGGPAAGAGAKRTSPKAGAKGKASKKRQQVRIGEKRLSVSLLVCSWNARVHDRHHDAKEAPQIFCHVIMIISGQTVVRKIN